MDPIVYQRIRPCDSFRLSFPWLPALLPGDRVREAEDLQNHPPSRLDGLVYRLRFFTLQTIQAAHP